MRNQIKSNKTMQDVSDIYALVQHHGIELPIAENSLSAQLLQGAEQQRWKTDEEARDALYGTSTQGSKFKTLRSRVLDMLLRAVLQIQVRGDAPSEYLKAYIKCLRNTTATLMLSRLGAKEAAIAVSDNLLRATERYEFSELTMQLLQLRRDCYALWNMEREFEQTHQRMVHAANVAAAEREAEYLLDHLRLRATVENSTASPLQHIYRRTLERVSELYGLYGTNVLRLHLARAQVLFYEQCNNFEAVQGACMDVIEHIQQYPHRNTKARKAEFLIRCIASQVFRRMELSAELLDECRSLMRAGSFNWYALRGLECASLLFHAKYTAALRVYQECTSRSDFASLAMAARERWTLIRAYLVLVWEHGLLPEGANVAQGFRLSTFRNSMDWETKDKQGSNALIVIFECVYLTLRGSREEAERRIEYLNVYASRYLREPTHARLRMLVKYLHSSLRMWDDVGRMEGYYEEMREKISTTPPLPMPGEINEVLRYEVLMEIVMHRLRRGIA